MLAGRLVLLWGVSSGPVGMVVMLVIIRFFILAGKNRRNKCLLRVVGKMLVS